MVKTSKIRNIYSKIQTQLFYMIPEKWNKIYLYASIWENEDQKETGEMFFYYFPKGILKKNPVNVYEVPYKFNVREETYINLANQLYETIKTLREEFKNYEKKLWTSVTISIEELKFRVEYYYENLNNCNYSNEDRHIIWKYKYLGVPRERFSKKEQEMIENYLLDEKFQDIEVQEDIEDMYRKKIHNTIEYDREEEKYQKESTQENEPKVHTKKKKLDKYELYKVKQKEKQQKEKENVIVEQKMRTKNQILSC